jgi:hypothetical protein
MPRTCPQCGRPYDDGAPTCSCPPPASDAAWGDEEAVLPHEGAETPPWAEEAPASPGRKRLAFLGSDQTRFILAFVAPPAGVALGALSCCCCLPVAPLVAPLLAALAMTLGCALYWGCPQATEAGRWIYLAITVLVWLVTGGVVGSIIWGVAGP